MNNVMYQKDLVELFGDPRDSSFANDYKTVMDFSEFAAYFGHVLDYEGNQWSCKIYGNYVLEDPLRGALRRICERGLASELHSYDGCFNIRKMKGGNSLSVHSWGLAVDFNAAENPFGGDVALSDEFILCFAECGFEAGALWGTPDGMHFQLPLTSNKWLTSTNPLRPRVG